MGPWKLHPATTPCRLPYRVTRKPGFLGSPRCPRPAALSRLPPGRNEFVHSVAGLSLICPSLAACATVAVASADAIADAALRFQW